MMHTPAHKTLATPAGQTLADDNARTAALDTDGKVTTQPDARITGIGSSTPMLHLYSDAAREWGDENISPDTMQWGDAWALTPRQVNDVRCNMQGCGLVVA